MACSSYGLTCFTDIEPDSANCVRLKAKVEEYFEAYRPDHEPHECKEWYWGITRVYGSLHYVVYFPDAASRELCISNSKDVPKPVCEMDLSKHGSKSCSPSPHRGAKPSSPNSATKSKLSDANNVDIKILDAMRVFGLIEKKNYDEKIGRYLRWTEQFAVILVLPVEEYEKLRDQKESYLSGYVLNKYAEFAIPSSHTKYLDHPKEEDRKVLHTEVKLMGDPIRSPVNLAVPYDRSSLVKIITDHEMRQWENGHCYENIKYKVFLYSAIEICKLCWAAIYRSIFVNLVRKGRVDNDTKPVIGYGFKMDSSENDLHVQENDHRAIVISPKHPTTPHKPSDNLSKSNQLPAKKAADVKRNIIRDLESDKENQQSGEAAAKN